MPHPLFALAAFLCLPALAAPPLADPCPSEETGKAQGAIAEGWKDSYNSGDSARLERLYDERAWYLTQHSIEGVIHGGSRIRAYFEGGIRAGFHVDSIRLLSTFRSGDFAWSVGDYESTNAGQKDFGVNLVVARRTGGRWLIVAHSSAVPDPKTAVRRLPVLE